MLSKKEKAVKHWLLECPTLRVPREDEDCCVDCIHYVGDPEVDTCEKHGLAHDWDQCESINFIYLICNDFIAKPKLAGD